MFLVKNDLLPFILPEELEEITRADDAICLQAMTAAVSEMRGWLYDSFDVETIFAQTPPANGAPELRHPLLVQFGADIAIFTIISRSMAGQGFEERKARYDRALNWLKAVAKSEHYSDLPRREQTKQSVVKYGSQPKRANYF